ncbi:MAG TPA: histidine phosphatase family protein [Gaiellaceae bacterium]|nr:histidine phosphatase family protein [Gaiellaceae bacterium]
MSVILLRHASAGDRDAWTGDDRARPLDAAGRADADALRGAMRATRVVSSPYVRCVETVEPLAASLGLEVELDDRLAEGGSRAGALALLAELDGGVACTHGDIVEAVLGAPLVKGAAVVLELAGNEIRVLERLPATSP